MTGNWSGGALKRFISIILLFLASCCFQNAVGEKQLGTLTAGSESVNVGQTITFNYNIENFSDYKEVVYNASARFDDMNISGQLFDAGNLSAATGSFQVTPKFGNYLEVSIVLVDKNDEMYFIEGKVIPILGWVRNDPKITITANKTSAKIGDTITFTYSIEGDIRMDSITAQLSGVNRIVYDKKQWMEYNETIPLKRKKGTFKGKVAFGYWARAQILLEDSIGLIHVAYSPEIEITDFVPLTPTITITPQDGVVEAGDTVTFEYSISGPGKYSELTANILYSPDQFTLISGQSIPLDSLTGTFSTVVRPEFYMAANISVLDQIGQHHIVATDKIFIKNEGEKWLVLPRNLTSIEAGAFKGTDFEHLWIPDTVTSIADDAFDEIKNKLTIYGTISSAADMFSLTHEIEFVWYGPW